MQALVSGWRQIFVDILTKSAQCYSSPQCSIKKPKPGSTLAIGENIYIAT
jgi:hypothetical protein